ncbi:MAG TPA: carboxypeptidase regulatory-like domain-containing protein, partial [Gemmatimonadaceae bacterium]
MTFPDWLGRIRIPTVAICLCVTQAAFAQDTGVIAGRVRDSTSGNPRSGAVVTVVGSGARGSTGADGRFVLAQVPAGPKQVQVRAIGFLPAISDVIVRAGETTRVEIRLAANPVTLRTIRVAAAPTERDEFTNAPNVGAVTLSTRAVQVVPRFGEADVARAVQLAPGIEARNDYSTGFNVHGGESDQNLILIDNYPIYNPFHLGGLFSTFVGSTVRDVRLLTGSIPAQFGGRLSSVMDVRSAEEPREGLHGGAEVSVLAATASLGSAFGNQRGSWNVAARRTYADQLVDWFSEDRLPYHFRDEQGHLSFQLTPTVDLAVTVYDGRDVMDGSFSEVGDSSKAHAGGGAFFFSWGNLVAGGSVSKAFGRTLLGDSGRAEQRLSTSRFSTQLDLGSGSLAVQNSLDDVRLSGTITALSSAGSRMIGYDVDRFAIDYSTLAGRASIDPVISHQSPTGAGVFYDQLWKPSSRLIVEGGLRAEAMTGRDYKSLSPRFSAKWLTGPSSAITIGAGRYTQWIHSTTLEDDPILLFDYWRASDSVTPVSSAWQYVLGHERWLAGER